MKAKVARDLAIASANSEIEAINKQIEIEAKKGCTQCSINNISQAAKAYLKEEGYEIEEISYGATYSNVIIRW